MSSHDDIERTYLAAVCLSAGLRVDADPLPASRADTDLLRAAALGAVHGRCLEGAPISRAGLLSQIEDDSREPVQEEDEAPMHDANAAWLAGNRRGMLEMLDALEAWEASSIGNRPPLTTWMADRRAKLGSGS